MALYPDLGVERIPTGYGNLIALPEVHRVDLRTLGWQDRSTPGWELLRLIVDDTAVARAARLIHGGPTPLEPDVLNFIETILVYQLPRCRREEIQTMLGLTDIDLKQTQFYQDVFAEGEQYGEKRGEQRGEQRGRQQEAVNLLRRLLTRRFGPLPDWAEQRLQGATLAELESWADRMLDAPTLHAVWRESV